MAAKSTLGDAIKALRGEIDNRKGEIAAMEGKRQAIADACPSRADLFQAIDQRLAHDAEKYRAVLGKAFDAIAGTPLEVDSRLSASTERYGIDLTALATGPHGRGPGPEGASGLALALLMGDMLRESLHREAEHWLADKTEGLPLAARRAEIARLDAEIEGKRSALSGLLAEAQAAGVVISP
jgi:hypothetical protein